MQFTCTWGGTTVRIGCPFDNDVIPPEPEPPTNEYDAATEMPPQVFGWTCSACSLDWILRATGLAPGHTRPQAVLEIGLPENINPTYGLMDGSGAQLQRVLRDYGQESQQGWLSFDEVYELASRGPGMMSGQAWYHWVGVRGVVGYDLWIANSAEGYQGIYEVLDRADFSRLGPFSCVFLA
jgi:hypothetical protein